MSEKIAKFLLLIFKPAIIPLIALFFIFNSETYLSLYPLAMQVRLYVVIFLSTFLIPATLIPLLFGVNAFDNLKIESKKDNIIFLSILAVANLASYFLLKNMPIYIDEFILVIFMISTVIVAVSILISIFRKMCYHLLSLGSLCGFFIAISILFAKDYYIYIISVFIFAGFIGFAKMQLEKNNIIQLFSSFILGFFLSLITIFIM